MSKPTAYKTIIPHAFILIVGLLAFLFIHSGYQFMLKNNFATFELFDQISKDIVGYFYLIQKLLLPVELSIDPQINDNWNIILAIKAFVIALMLAVSWYYRKKAPWLMLSIFWFFIILVPNLSFIPRHDIINERHAYLASVGLFLIFVKWLLKLPRHYHKVVMIIIVLIFSWQTRQRNLDYSSEISLWKVETKTYPRNSRAWQNLGYAYQINGQIEYAKSCYYKSLSIEATEITRNNLKQLTSPIILK